MERDQVRNLILAFYIPSALISIAVSLLIPVLPVYAGQLTTAYVLIGIVLAATSIGRVFGDLPASWVIRRIGLKYTMMSGTFFSLLPIVLLFFVESVWLTIVLLFLSGAAQALFNIARHAYIAVEIKTASRGRAISIFGGVGRLGKFIGPLIGGWVGGYFGLESAFLAFGVISLLSVFFVWRFMVHIPVNKETNDDSAQHVLMGRVMREQKRVFATAGTGQILAQMTREGWKVLIPLYAANVLGLDVQTIGYIVGAGAAMDALFFYVSGVVMDRFGRKWAIVPSFVLQAIGVGLILISQSALVLGFIAGFIGFANGLSSGTMMTIGADFAPANMRGEFLSLWRLIGDTGMVGAPLIIGTVAQALLLQTSVLVVTGSGVGAALLFALFVPETLKKRKSKTVAFKNS